MAWSNAVALAALVFVGCATTPAVAPGSEAEVQLHERCPASGVCAAPLICVGGADEREEATCELACDGACPLPLQCMARPDGQRGGICTAPQASPRPRGT